MLTNEEFAAFDALDLNPIKMKLMHVESGEGWSQSRADEVAREYRRFLFLMKKFPNEQASPTVDVDVFWHYHILDTMKYAADCEHLFGHFLHHYPYVGLDDGADEGEHESSGERMRELYQMAFGPAAADGQAAAWCCVATGPATAQSTAWCCVATEPAKAQSAWCCVATEPAKVQSAWCCVATEPARKAQSSAWCCVATEPAKTAQSTAWCCVATKPRKGIAGSSKTVRKALGLEANAARFRQFFGERLAA